MDAVYAMWAFYLLFPEAENSDPAPPFSRLSDTDMADRSIAYENSKNVIIPTR